MGCNFVTEQIDGAKTREEVKTIFARLQDQDRYENGHSYSGGLGMTTGLIFDDKTFESTEAAEEWLDEHARKWDEARCVTVKENGKTFWLIGANCAS